MTSITIIVVVVVALLTVVILGLAWIAYTSCLKTYRTEVAAGVHDNAIAKQFSKKTKKERVGVICSMVTSYTFLLALFSLFIIGIVYSASGNRFHINNETALVIKTGSMARCYNTELEQKYEELGYDVSLHFDVGDICVFEEASQSDLVEGEVYGYKYRDIIITHRLVGFDGDAYTFRGDYNAASDALAISRDKIIYHYTGRKVPGLGAFVLYAHSYFGLWSLIGIMSVVVSSEVILYQVNLINKHRYTILEGHSHAE